jgi:hypothetical protein
VGKMLAAQCMGTVKRVSLELGGNAPFIIFNSADIDAGIEAVVASKFRSKFDLILHKNFQIYFRSSISAFSIFNATFKEKNLNFFIFAFCVLMDQMLVKHVSRPIAFMLKAEFMKILS